MFHILSIRLPSLIFLLLLIISLTPISSVVEYSPSSITWGLVTRYDIGVSNVASGVYDLLLYPNTIDNIPPSIVKNLTLIRTVSNIYSLMFNVAQNIIDPEKPGIVKLYDRVYPGRYIPGLLLVDPREKGFGDWVNWSDIYGREEFYHDLHWNPLAIREIRVAINYLINRRAIVDDIYYGNAEIRYGAISSFDPTYPLVRHVYFDEYGFTPTGNITKALIFFNDALARVNSTLLSYDMMLKYVDDSSAPSGRWLYFYKPDGSRERVEINFVIRVDDERYSIGLMIADWIEEYLGIYVDKHFYDRQVIWDIYVSNPVDKVLNERDYWSMYTEGWLVTDEYLDAQTRHDVAFFYAPLKGWGPNSGFTFWWYWYNETFYELGCRLHRGIYVDRDELVNDTIEGLRLGLYESMRVFLVDAYYYYIANRDKLENVEPGIVTGLRSLWGLRSLEFSERNIHYLGFSPHGRLISGSWNPVKGFGDGIGDAIHKYVSDYSFWSRPDNGVPKPIRVESYRVERGPFKLNQVNGYIYDPVSNRWVHISRANEVFLNYTYHAIEGYNVTDIKTNSSLIRCRVIINYASPDGITLGKWHDGSDITMADILYWIAFTYEWSFDDKIATNTTDPYYDAKVNTGLWFRVFGVRVINNTALEVWVDYDDIYDALIASYVSVWPDMPWHVMYAVEEIIVNEPILPSGNIYRWGSDLEHIGISLIESTHADDIKYYIKTNLSIGPRMPPYITTYPGIAAPTADEVWARYNNTVNFINTYRHAYVSSGPYKITEYDPETHTLTIEQFTDYVLPMDYFKDTYTPLTLSINSYLENDTLYAVIEYDGSKPDPEDLTIYGIVFDVYGDIIRNIRFNYTVMQYDILNKKIYVEIEENISTLGLMGGYLIELIPIHHNASVINIDTISIIRITTSIEPPYGVWGYFNGSIVLVWYSNDTSVYAFKIYRSINGETYELLNTTRSRGVVNVYVDREVERNKTYYYRISSISYYGESIPAEISITTSNHLLIDFDTYHMVSSGKYRLYIAVDNYTSRGTIKIHVLEGYVSSDTIEVYFFNLYEVIYYTPIELKAVREHMSVYLINDEGKVVDEIAFSIYIHPLNISPIKTYDTSWIHLRDTYNFSNKYVPWSKGGIAYGLAYTELLYYMHYVVNKSGYPYYPSNYPNPEPRKTWDLFVNPNFTNGVLNNVSFAILFHQLQGWIDTSDLASAVAWSNLSKELDKLLNNLETNTPVMLILGPYNLHVVVAWKVIEDDSGRYIIFVSDPNYPGKVRYALYDQSSDEFYYVAKHFWYRFAVVKAKLKIYFIPDLLESILEWPNITKYKYWFIVSYFYTNISLEDEYGHTSYFTEIGNSQSLHNSIPGVAGISESNVIAFAIPRRLRVTVSIDSLYGGSTAIFWIDEKEPALYCYTFQATKNSSFTLEFSTNGFNITTDNYAVLLNIDLAKCTFNETQWLSLHVIELNRSIQAMFTILDWNRLNDRKSPAIHFKLVNLINNKTIVETYLKDGDIIASLITPSSTPSTTGTSSTPTITEREKPTGTLVVVIIVLIVMATGIAIIYIMFKKK